MDPTYDFNITFAAHGAQREGSSLLHYLVKKNTEPPIGVSLSHLHCYEKDPDPVAVTNSMSARMHIQDGLIKSASFDFTINGSVPLPVSDDYSMNLTVAESTYGKVYGSEGIKIKFYGATGTGNVQVTPIKWTWGSQNFTMTLTNGTDGTVLAKTTGILTGERILNYATSCPEFVNLYGFTLGANATSSFISALSVIFQILIMISVSSFGDYGTIRYQ